MALRTCDGGMPSRQGPVRINRVIELRVQPVGSRVAGRAVMRKIELHVRRVLAAREVRLVTRKARCRRSFEYVVQVACSAGQRCVRAGESVAGYPKMIKFRVEPRAHRVARLAGRRKTCRHMIEHRSMKVLLVAGVARGRKPDELTDRRIPVAVFALQHRMSAHQRKTVLVVLNVPG